MREFHNNSGALKSIVYSSAGGNSIRRSIKNLFIEIQDFNSESFSDLRSAFNVALTYSRSLVCFNPSENFWENHITEIRAAYERLQNQFNTDEKEVILSAISEIEKHAAEVTNDHAERVLTALNATSGRVLVLPETVRLGRYFRDFIRHHGLESRVEVILDKSQLKSVNQGFFDLLLMPGAPNKYLQRPNFDIYLRSLFFSGCASRALFISPEWSFFREDEKFLASIFNGLDSKIVPEMQIELQAVVEISSHVDDLEIEVFEGRLDFSGVEKLEHDGTVACRILFLECELAYPVEEDAVSVSVLEKNELGEWELARKSPFSAPLEGSLLVACIDGSEQESLRQRAARDMGQQYELYTRSQESWKSKLDSLKHDLAEEKFHALLRENGVSKVLRTSYWTLPESVQPNLKTDFIGVLSCLGLDEKTMRSTIHLADEYLNHLRNAGRQAGRALVEALEEDELSRLESGASIQVVLADFGDAEYLVSPVISVGKQEVQCRPSQIRKVTLLAPEGRT